MTEESGLNLALTPVVDGKRDRMQAEDKEYRHYQIYNYHSEDTVIIEFILPQKG
jgi:hypothetical protein